MPKRFLGTEQRKDKMGIESHRKTQCLKIVLNRE